jgi:hypothetical protein
VKNEPINPRRRYFLGATTGSLGGKNIFPHAVPPQ